MKARQRTVTVIRFPETLRRGEARLVFRDIENRMNPHHPWIVLDCSKACKMDRVAVHMLLSCLEAAIKRNGDVKLAAVTTSARETLGLTRADRLFEIYDTETEAVNSFFHTGCVRGSYEQGVS
jgi:anti-anti-sigma regulatory factor